MISTPGCSPPLIQSLHTLQYWTIHFVCINYTTYITRLVIKSMDLLDSCKRYIPDDNEMRELFEAERDINLDETATMENLAAAYAVTVCSNACTIMIYF